MKSFLLAGCAALAITLPVAAQSDSETEARQTTINVLGLRPVASDDVTSSVSVLDASDLAVRDASFIADELRAVPGLGISRSGTQAGLTQIRIRGAEANHTLVLLNGIEVSDPVNGETDFGLFSGLQLDRVEVARGEQSTLYGSDAIGGVINLVTSDSPATTAEIEMGTQDTYRGSASTGFANETSSLSAGISGFTTSGVDVSGRGGEEDGSESYSAIVTGTHNTGSFGTLSGLFTYRSTTSQTDPDTDYDGVLDNADRETDSEQWLIGGRYDVMAFGLDHAFSASFNSVTRENSADGAYTDEAIGERTKLSYSPADTYEISGAEVFAAGLIDWEQEDYERRGTASFYGDPNQTQTFETLGLAAETRVSFDAVTLNASVRHDDNDGRFEDATTWRLGAAFDVSETTRLRASAGEGVKNPTFTELFGYYPGTFIGNPDLEPESSSSWEVGIDQELGPVLLSLTYFDASLENEIYTAYTPSFESTPANRSGTSERSGAEAAVSWAVSDTISVEASATYVDSTNDSDVAEIRVPEWTGSLSADWVSPDVDGMRAGIAFDYVGDQFDTDFGTYQTVTLDEYVLVSGTFEYPLNDRLAVTLRGENLLDVEVVDVVGYHAPGVAAFIGLKLR
tara:strand:+ start:21030 stop:22907 length:1878 start_codon:yes stop_codon:yes gene_type:complete